MDLTITLLRPDDLLALVVEATNMRLDTSDPSQPRLLRDSGGHPALLTFRFPPQSIIERAYVETSAYTQPTYNPPPSDPPLPSPPLPSTTTEQPDLPGSVEARMSGESRLVFRVPDDLASIPYSIEGLLDWSRLEPVLPPAALVLPGASHAPGDGPPAIAEPEADETALELPYRLILSPNVSPHASPAWLHSASPVDHAGRTELWHTRLGSEPTQPANATAVEASSENQLPVRAVWSPDVISDDGAQFRAAMSASDRQQIVILTSGFSGYTLTAKDHSQSTYVPEPVSTERLFLSALGGWLSSRGAWKYPVTFRYPSARTVESGPALPSAGLSGADASRALGDEAIAGGVGELDLIEWDHIATQGRDHYVRIVYEGFLYPFGHQASLVKITERKVLAPNGGTNENQADSPVAYLRQRMYIVVRERQKTYPAGKPYQYEGREMPLRSLIRVDVAVTPDIDPLSGLNQVGEESFWIRINNIPYLFPVVGRDAAGQNINFLAPMIFVPLTEKRLDEVHQGYAEQNDQRQCAVRGSKVAYADPAAGDTVLKTASLYFTAEITTSAPPFVDAPFLPSLDLAAVTVPALSALLGQNTAVVISLYLPYLEHDIDPNAGVFATVIGTVAGTPVPVPVAFSADKSGGFARPNITLSALSARKGLVSGTPEDAASGTINPSQYFSDIDAKLFGVINLGDIISASGLLDAARNAPEIRTHAVPDQRNPTQLVTVITWEPQLANSPPTSSQFVTIAFNNGGQASTFSLKVRLEQQLNGTPPVFTAQGKVSNFVLTVANVIGLVIDEITFDSSSGGKPDVSLQLAKQQPIQFQGPLEFIQTLADILPPGLFGGSGPSITIGSSALEVSYTIGIPPVPCGVFSLTDISILAGLDLPYLDGKPAVEFGFAARNRPFLVTVEIFGGGGFVHLVLDADGIQMVEGSIEFGANFSLDLGVASGAVHAMAGIYFQLKGSSSDLTGFVDIGGEVSVLGIISISLDLNISLSWQQSSSGNVIEGRATLTVSVHVLFFSASVQLSVERSFSAGGGDPKVYQQMTAGQWSLYAGAFG